jgi:hypothetical protein
MVGLVGCWLRYLNGPVVLRARRMLIQLRRLQGLGQQIFVATKINDSFQHF